MKLIKLSQYQRTRWVEGSAPSMATLRRRCEQGEYPALRDGKLWYIDLDQMPDAGIDSLVQKVLNA